MDIFFRYILKGKTIGRALFTRELNKHVKLISGRVIDLGSGGSPSYRSLLPSAIEYVPTDLKLPSDIGLSVDLNMPLPFADYSEKTIFCFNTLYILNDPQFFVQEVYRVLSADGKFLLSSPLLWSEIPEPHDYARFTAEGIERLLRNAGFTDITISRYGERFSVCANLLHSFLYFRIIRIPVDVIAVLLDKLIPRTFREAHPAPLGYFVVAKK